MSLSLVTVKSKPIQEMKMTHFDKQGNKIVQHVQDLISLKLGTWALKMSCMKSDIVQNEKNDLIMNIVISNITLP